jgi:hypothetical protein
MECTAQQTSFGICIMGAARSNCIHAFMIQKGDPGAKKPEAVKQPCRAPKDACRTAKHDNFAVVIRLAATQKLRFSGRPSAGMFQAKETGIARSRLL